MRDDPPVEPVTIVACDRWLVLDKPAGWHTLARRNEPLDALSVESWLRRRMPTHAAIEEAGLVHRLDRWTSGCLLVARSESARCELRAAISDQGTGIRKTYLAAVRCGIDATGSFALYFTGRHRSSAKVSVSERGEPRWIGQCRWQRIVQTSTADLIEVDLLGPGRRHQIRAGFAHLGHPLAGDTLYRGDLQLPGLEGPALHAWRLAVEGTMVEAPLPDAWRQFHSFVSRRTNG